MRRLATLLCFFSLLVSSLFGQGLDTTASKDDWEEINFEFNYAVLTDGFPSLLRLAELLQKHPDYKVKVEGHADKIGSNAYNDKLAARRADTVKAFLVKYGANANQITTASLGKRQPKVSDATKPGRFMNRRVTLTVTDGSGKVVAAGGISEAIAGIPDILAAQKKCCDDILKKLDKLDEIADMLRGMKSENDALKQELANLKKAQSDLDAYVKAQPKPLTSSETASIVDTRTAEQIEKARMPRFSLLAANVGGDSRTGDVTFTGRGRFFAPFKEQFAFQAQGEYMYFRDRKEGQFDFGLVDRFTSRAQFGLFNSFKYVTVNGMQSGGTMAQAAGTLDYIFSRGRVGVFGTKGYMNSGVINRVAVGTTRNIFDETYLGVVDQAGASAQIGLMGNNYVEGNVGYLRSYAHGDRPGGTVRFVFPIRDKFAFTLEGGVNETLLGSGNDGRAVVGFQVGNFQRPKDYMDGINGIQHAVPVDIPRVRYEMITRRVRTGNSPPVADAGPDQIGVPAGTITLNGSGSFDPEGDPITFQWVQIAGPAVTITNPLTSIATFTAGEGQSYAFRLTVTDSQGAQGIARVNVTTSTAKAPQIIFFNSTPSRITRGQTSTLTWQVVNATEISVTSLGNVGRNGNYDVRPTNTTQYVLTAKNGSGTVSATTTVQVDAEPLPNLPAFTQCSVSPTNIMAGESATISYLTSGATEVNISGIGRVADNGTQVVTPTASTTYTLTARNAAGPVTCNVTVQVTAGTAPRIVNFAANPMTITAGDSSTLSWNVENAKTVSITSLGTVNASGSQAVTPATTTTYTLTATNDGGSVTATATITVNPKTGGGGGGGGTAPTVTSCAASPSTTAKPGDPVVISYLAQNATGITISGVNGATIAGPVTVNPQATTTYNIVVTGANNQTANCTVTVTVPTPVPPVAVITGPSLIETIYRQVSLDASQSTNPSGGALTYTWEPLSTGAAVLDQGQPITRVQLGGLFGDYIFRLTVRNAAGQSDSTTVTVRFRNTNPH